MMPMETCSDQRKPDNDCPPADYRCDFLPAAAADALLARLLSETPWRQDAIRLMGRVVALPRLTAWYGDAGAAYRYSGLTLAPLPFTPALADLRLAVEHAVGARFNSVLLNFYRNGADSVSWHSDDEAELGPDPVIASISLGAVRRFDLRRKDRYDTRAAFDLGHGSLLVMGRGCQTGWHHRIAKARRITVPRINLTFRLIALPAG
jgi:alkylated DNA repair dioxygenase AlkB